MKVEAAQVFQPATPLGAMMVQLGAQDQHAVSAIPVVGVLMEFRKDEEDGGYSTFKVLLLDGGDVVTPDEVEETYPSSKVIVGPLNDQGFWPTAIAFAVHDLQRKRALKDTGEKRP